MTTRRGFLGSLLAVAAAPALAGFTAKPVPRAIAPERYVSVLWFGADPSGVEDSTEAFREAVREANRRGQPVIIPAGNYRVRNLSRGWYEGDGGLSRSSDRCGKFLRLNDVMP